MGRPKKQRIRNSSTRQTQEGESSNGLCGFSESSNERPETGEESSVLGLLSDDSMLQILRNLSTRFLLSSASLVCRRWRRLCCSHLVLEIVPSPLSAYTLPWDSMGEGEIEELVKRNASTLERVFFTGTNKPAFNKIIALLRVLPRLKGFALISSSLIEAEVEELVKALPAQLTCLDLHNDHVLSGTCEENWQNTHVPMLNVFAQELSIRCPDLRHLNLGFHNYMSIESLDMLLLAVPHLCTLNLQSATIGWLEVSKIFGRCPLLESISIVSGSLSKEQEDSDDDDDGALFQNLRARRHFDSKSSSYPDLASLIHAPLRSVRFYSTPHRSVPLDVMPIVGLLKDKGQQLQYLHAQSLYNTSWHTVSVWCGNLQTLDLSHARALPYAATGIEEVVLSGLPRLLKGLERLGLPSVTDRVLIEVGRFCTKLKEIHFEGHASSYGLINNQAKVTDLGVVALAEGCPDLQVISLAGCVNVSVASLRALAFHCRYLKALLLPGCTKINDDAIATVWPRLGKSLLVLDLVGCKMTPKAIKMLYQLGQVYVTSLLVLAISRSLSKSAKSELAQLTDGLPLLQVLSRTTGLPWDGYFGSFTLEELIPHPRTVRK